jgi:hypothetical protein
MLQYNYRPAHPWKSVQSGRYQSMGRNGVSAYFYCESHDHPGSTGFVSTDSYQAMQPIYGRLSDIFGRKVVLLASLTVFWIGSLACALAQVRLLRCDDQEASLIARA